MTDMRELSDEFKLSVRSIYEVFETLSNLVTRLAGDRSIRLRENGKEKRPTRAAVVSALVVWLSEQTEAQQRAIVARGIASLNAMLEHDGPAEFGALDNESGVATDTENNSPVAGSGHATQAVRVDVDTGKPINPKGKRKGTG
jgi:predicted DNA-binding transcriptional regulator YafY